MRHLLHAAQLLALQIHGILEDHHARQETPRENRYFISQNVRIEELLAHEFKGLLVRASYSCPKHMRGQLMKNSGRFDEGMLCALMGLDEDGVSLSTTFFAVHQRQTTNSIREKDPNDARAAVQLSFLQSTKFEDVLRLVRYAQDLSSARFVLAEFPKMLYEGFYWVLRRLQEMSSDAFAFGNYIAPRVTPAFIADSMMDTLAGSRRAIPVLLPAYAQQPGFHYDLSCLADSASSTSGESQRKVLGVHPRQL